MKKIPHLEMSTYLVTGGCGFIGSHLVRSLLESNPKKIIVLDSLEFGNKSNLPQNSLIEVIQHRLGFDKPNTLDEYLQNIDYVFHLAAEKYNQSAQDPERIIRANIIGTEQLLAACGRQKIKKFIFTSSLYAYGRMHGGPYQETESVAPNTVYGISKVAGEHLVNQYSSQYFFDSCILRLMFTYGPRQFSKLGYKSVIVKTFERVFEGLPAQICGDGQQVLDYIYVSDVVNALMFALEPKFTERCPILNIGSGSGRTIKSVVENILTLCGCPIPAEFVAADRTAGSSRVASVEKITSWGWKPEVSLQEGLALVLNELNPLK